MNTRPSSRFANVFVEYFDFPYRYTGKALRAMFVSFFPSLRGRGLINGETRIYLPSHRRIIQEQTRPAYAGKLLNRMTGHPLYNTEPVRKEQNRLWTATAEACESSSKSDQAVHDAAMFALDPRDSFVEMRIKPSDEYEAQMRAYQRASISAVRPSSASSSSASSSSSSSSSSSHAARSVEGESQIWGDVEGGADLNAGSLYETTQPLALNYEPPTSPGERNFEPLTLAGDR